VPRLLDGIQAVVFDAVGTVIYPDPPAPLVYAAIGRQFGSRLTPDIIAARFRTAFRDEEFWDHQHNLQTGEDRERGRWQHIVGRVLDDVTDAQACFRKLFMHFAQPAAWRCDPELGAVLAELAARGLALGIASNYDSRLRAVAKGLKVLEPVQFLIISSEVGWRKPARQFFAEVSRCLGFPAAAILHIGDDPANDYEGAREAGLRAVLFDPHAKVSTAGIEPIASLRDLLVV
jgi:putative hydrolase of the HAD superfamily